MEPENPERAARQAEAMRHALEKIDREEAAKAARSTSPAPAKPKAPAGWYPHPSMADTQRYWDGQKWTEHIAPGAPVSTQPVRPIQAPPPGVSQGVVAVGIISSLLLPLVGFVIGVVCLAKGESKAGIVMMVISVVVSVAYLNSLA